MENKNHIISYIVTFFVGCLIMYGITRYMPVTVNQNVTKLDKEVTVTETGIADAVEKVYDAVVVVSTYKDNKYIASGTGFVYQKNKDTYSILTNNHVIDGGDKITVTFTDKTVKDVKVIGSDEFADIAVLQLESKKELKVAELGDNKKTRVGDTSFAVGAPLDSAYSWSVTRGIISGKDRLVEVSLEKNLFNNTDYIMKVIQTDTAINAGNSGGPLCNSNGEVIGITSLKLVSSGVESMGFAIPIEDALEKASEIMSGVKKEKPYLGVSMVSSYYMPEYNVEDGIVVMSVDKGSCAEKAGIKTGDVITKMDGKEVLNSAYLRYYLYQYSIGDKVTLTIIRNGEEKQVKVILKGKN